MEYLVVAIISICGGAYLGFWLSRDNAMDTDSVRRYVDGYRKGFNDATELCERRHVWKV